MKRFHFILLLVVSAILTIYTPAWAYLTAEQMYLNPTLITPDEYSYEYYEAGYRAVFEDVVKLQVLPALKTDSLEYYYTPETDYFGDIDDYGAGYIQFDRPGAYFVLATYNDGSESLFDYGIDFLTRGEPKITYNWHVIPTPEPVIVITDPNPYPVKPPPKTATLPPSNPDFPASTKEINDLKTWTEVLNYLKKIPDGSNLHVELGGHGGTGAFYWNGVSIPASDFEALKGKVGYLTFMSCKTGAGSCSYLTEIAKYLGKAAGYTDVVGGNGSEWFINDAGKLKVVTIPAPGALVLASLGLLLVRKLHQQKAA